MRIFKFFLLSLFLLTCSSALPLEILIDYPLHEALDSDLSPSGGLLATSHRGNFIEIRSLKPPYLDGRLYSEKRDNIDELHFIDEGKLLAIREEGIELWERKGIKRWSLGVRLNRERGTPVAYGKSSIAYIPSEGKIEVYSLKGRASNIIEAPGDVKALSLSMDERALFVILKSGEVLAYELDREGQPLELGKLKEYSEIRDGRAVIVQERKAKVVDLGSSETLHEIKLKERADRVSLSGDSILFLSPKGNAYLFKLKEGNYILERELHGLKGLKVKLSENGLLSWSKEEVSLNGEKLVSVHRALVGSDFSLEGERLAQVGEGFAIVWSLRSFSPELFFKGEASLSDGKLYLKGKETYICYDLRKGESEEVKKIEEKGEIILKEEGLLLRNDGLYELRTRERILDLRGKRFFLFKDIESLVVLQDGEMVIYKLKGRVAKRMRIPYKNAFASEKRGLIALVSPDELSFTLFNLRDESERTAEDERLSRIREITFFGDAILALGESGFALFDENGKGLLFEEMRGIERVIKIDDDRALISRRDGTLWLYSIKRRRPLIYHDLNGIVRKATLKENKILALLETGELYILSARNPNLWLCFLPISQEDWIIISSGSYFNSSPKAQGMVLWLDGKNIYPGERGFERYKNPIGLRRIWDEL